MVLLVLLDGTISSKQAQGSAVSNRITIKFGRIIPQLLNPLSFPDISI